jgi:hypothetical protein
MTGEQPYKDHELVSAGELHGNIRSLFLGRANSALGDFASTHHVDRSALTLAADDAATVVATLRPQFEAVIDPVARRARRTAELRRCLDEQLAVLDAARDEPRVLVNGPAGSGKSMLAVELAQERAARGERVLFLTYNNLFHGWASERCEAINERVAGHVEARTITGVLREAAGIRDDATDIDFDALPMQALPTLEAQFSDGGRWDFVIVDEAQDILRGQFSFCLDALVEGGLAGGSWTVFGDFDNQAIYGGNDELRGGALLRDLGAEFRPVYLSANCRNTPVHATDACMLGGVRP